MASDDCLSLLPEAFPQSGLHGVLHTTGCHAVASSSLSCLQVPVVLLIHWTCLGVINVGVDIIGVCDCVGNIHGQG